MRELPKNRIEDVANVDSGSQRIVITLRECDNVRFLVLRMYEIDATTHKFVPTELAVGMDASIFVQVKIAFDEWNDYILKWLGSATLSVVNKVHMNMIAEVAARQEVSHRSHQSNVRLSSWKGPRFFEARSEGARVVVELNTEHPAIGVPPNEWGELLGRILAAYHDAKNRFLGPADHKTAQLFTQLEYEWGTMLKNSVKWV